MKIFIIINGRGSVRLIKVVVLRRLRRRQPLLKTNEFDFEKRQDDVKKVYSTYSLSRDSITLPIYNFLEKRC